MIDSFVPPIGFVGVNISLSRQALEHVFIDGRTPATDLPVKPRHGTWCEIQMKQIAE